MAPRPTMARTMFPAAKIPITAKTAPRIVNVRTGSELVIVLQLSVRGGDWSRRVIDFFLGDRARSLRFLIGSKS